MFPPLSSSKLSPAARFLITLLVVLTAAGVTGCRKDKKIGRDTGVPASEMYAKAKHSLDAQNWDRAIQQYRALTTVYPFGRYAEQAQLELAYAYYKGGKTELALSTADRFIRTYPTHPNVDYAYYLRGLTNYDVRVGFMERLMPSRVRDRDQTAAKESFRDFNELVRRFPDSRYAPDARQRMVFLRNNLSYYELDIARYYLRRKAYVAAANRARYMLETYPGSPETVNALELLYTCYTKMKLPELAEDTMKIIALNYPDSPLVSGKHKKKNFFKRLWPWGKD